MNIPDDLKVHYRDGLLELWSGDLVVEINVDKFRETAMFRGGPVAWETLQLRYLVPALAQFSAKRETDPVR